MLVLPSITPPFPMPSMLRLAYTSNTPPVARRSRLGGGWLLWCVFGLLWWVLLLFLFLVLVLFL